MESAEWSLTTRREMVEHDHPSLSLVQQCLLLGIWRSGLYYEPKRTIQEDELLIKQAIDKYDKPEIFNTDQGSEFTASAFTDILIENSIQISMDGKGRALDNIFVERFWRNVKYECIYLDRPENGAELLQCLSIWFDRNNRERPHQSLKYQTPENVYHAVA